MKKYTSSDSKPWNLGSVLMNWGLSSKLLSPIDESWMQDGSEVLMVQNLSCKDIGLAITRSGFGFCLGGKEFLVNLDEFESLNHTCIQTYYHKKAYQSAKKKLKKFNHAYSKGNLDLENS